MKLIFTILSIIVFTYCTAQNKIELQAYTTDEYSISYPKSWQLDSSRRPSIELFVLAPLDNEGDLFAENFNILIQDLQGQNIDEEDYKSITEGQITAMGNKAEMLLSEVVIKNNRKYYKSIFTMAMKDRTTKISSVCFIKNGKAYLLTFTCEISQFEKYESVAQATLNSFVVK